MKLSDIILGSNTVIKTDSHDGETVLARSQVLADTSAAAFSLLLPSAPAEGDFVFIYDKGSCFGTNNLTLDNNGNNINGLDTDLVFDVDNFAAELRYINATVGWKVFPKTESGGITVVTSMPTDPADNSLWLLVE